MTPEEIRKRNNIAAQKYRDSHRDQQRAASKRWTDKNKERCYEKQKARRTRNVTRQRAIYIEWKSKGCATCTQNDPGRIHAHHWKPKHKAVSELLTGTSSDKALYAELDKCIPLCHSCHRLVHNNHIKF